MDKKKIAPIAEHTIIPFFKLWVKEVTGIENLPEGGFILAPNHCSYFEHFILGSIIIPHLNRKLHFIAKKEHFEGVSQPLWHAAWTKYATSIPIDRSRGEGALLRALSYLKKGAIIVIYPEGTRSIDGNIQKGKTGVARLALWSGVPVVPVGFIGTYKILPKGESLPHFHRASVHIGKPLSFDKKRAPNRKLLREVTNTIMEEIARLSNQEYPFSNPTKDKQPKP